MKILHYSLGFPPYRTGGMTKFCVDLMRQQNRNGHQVALLWPGQISIIEQNTRVKDRGFFLGIRSFEIVNPLPVSYDEGIKQINSFILDAGRESYERLLNQFEPGVIHIHTLMGLHESFLFVAKKKGIRLIFTAHDFFPICPKVTMFRLGKICTSAESCDECSKCNSTALGMGKIKILQSPLYRRLKDSAIVKKIRKKHRDEYLINCSLKDENQVGTKDDFKRLREFYYAFLKYMDMIHYNSSITKAIYEMFFDLPNNCIISISHSDIVDCRKLKRFNDFIRIRYLGPNGGAKGFYLLKAALDRLWKVKSNFCLDIHFQPSEMSSYMKVHERYAYQDLEDIFEDTDVLVVPSIWYETFGFTVLEALSYGVPVILSGNVGARDILVPEAGIIIDDMDEDKLFQVMCDITPEKLKIMNQAICENQEIIVLDKVAQQIEMRCY